MEYMTFVYASIATMLIGISLESATSWIAIRGARKNFPDLWERSGSPTLLGNGDLTKAWPLVRYYRGRLYLEHIQHGETRFAPISDNDALNFAEKLRGPLLYTYYLAWFAAVVAFLLLMVPPMAR